MVGLKFLDKYRIKVYKQTSMLSQYARTISRRRRKDEANNER